jgi:hypothetical protein
MRNLSKAFIEDLVKEDGVLHSVLERVRQDHTLMLAIRKNYINVYYRGGNLLKIEEQGEGSYLPFFDKQYNSGKNIPVLRSATRANKGSASEWVGAFSHLKEIMDLYFSKNIKPEREFQQVVARENNFSTISNESEYFISDIEFADTKLKARFDMLAIRWLANQRKKGSNCRAAFVEMKYGDKALGGAAGLVKHLDDFSKLISDPKQYHAILKSMESQINQLNELSLLKFNSKENIELNENDKPEIIFVLANHNPRSKALRLILDDKDILKFSESGLFDLRFFVSSFAGYGMHSDCMLTLTKFRELLGKVDPWVKTKKHLV